MRWTGVIVIGLLCLAAPAAAQTATTFAQLEAQRVLKVGERIRVVDARGDPLTGVLHGLTPDLLTLEVDGVERQMRQADVRNIQRGGLGHAKLYGALIGATAGLVFAYAFASSYGENQAGQICDRCFMAVGAGTVPGGVGIGVGIGSLIERLHRQTVFIAPGTTSVSLVPIVGGGRLGVSLVARF